MSNSNNFDRFALRYCHWVIRWRWPVLFLSLLAFAACVAGAPRVQFDDNYRVFFSPDNPHLQALDELENTYAKEEGILFVLAPRDGDVFTRKTLAAIEELTEKAWQIPYCIRVESVTSFQYSRAVGDDIFVSDLVQDAQNLTDEELAHVREVALAEPLMVNRSLSSKGHVATVYASLELPGLEGGERTAPVLHARELAESIREAYPHIEIFLNGGSVLSYAFTEYTFQDMSTLTPIMYLVIFSLMVFTLRSVFATIGAIAVVLLSVGSGMGLAGWTDLHMTAVTASTPTIIMTLAVADSIHILVIMLGRMRDGVSKNDALIESLRVNMSPVFVTTFTTCIGLLSMNFSDVPPLRDFGNLTAMGIVGAYLYSILTLPAFLAVAPMRVRQRASASDGMMNALAEFVIRRQKALLLATAVVTLVMGGLAFQNEFNNNWTQWFDESTQFRKDLKFMDENLSGANSLEFSVASRESSGINSPEYLRNLEAFANFLRSEPAVDHVTCFTDIMKRLNKNMHGDDEKYYQLPESRELAAQYLLLYEMSLPYGQDLNNMINVDKSATRVTAITDNLDAIALTALRERSEKWLEDNAPAYMQSHGTGNGAMFASIAERTITSMVIGTPVALLCVSMTLVFTFRSIKFGLLSLVPNLVPLVMAFGTWALVVGRINFGVACVAGLSIGIVVDDTVHFMSKYLRARREMQLDSEDAVRYAFSSVGRAMWVTSLILVAGFGILTFSVFRFNSYMGMLTAMAIAYALLADLFFLPAVLMQFDRDAHSTDASPPR